MDKITEFIQEAKENTGTFTHYRNTGARRINIDFISHKENIRYIRSLAQKYFGSDLIEVHMVNNYRLRVAVKR